MQSARAVCIITALCCCVCCHAMLKAKQGERVSAAGGSGLTKDELRSVANIGFECFSDNEALAIQRRDCLCTFVANSTFVTSASCLAAADDTPCAIWFMQIIQNGQQSSLAKNKGCLPKKLSRRHPSEEFTVPANHRVHYEFSSQYGTFSHDIGLVFTRKPVPQVGKNIVRLPSLHHQPRVGEICHTVIVESAQMTLKHDASLPVEIVNRNECLAVYDRKVDRKVENTICGKILGEHAYTFVPGRPLICQSSNGSALAGVQTGGGIPKAKAGSERRLLFTNVGEFADWIGKPRNRMTVAFDLYN